MHEKSNLEILNYSKQSYKYKTFNLYLATCLWEIWAEKKPTKKHQSCIS